MSGNSFGKQPGGGFAKFTEQSLNSMRYAVEEAQLLGQPHIGTEHILLGLLREEQGIAYSVLHAAGVTLPSARAIVASPAEGDTEEPVDTETEPGLTQHAKQALEYSISEAPHSPSIYVSPQHILLGLLRVQDGAAIKVLERLGVQPDALRSAVMSAEGLPPASSPAQRASSIGAWLMAATQPRNENTAMSQHRFDKFTERARTVLQLSQEEAQRFNHNYIGTEHILLGLVREGEGVAAQALGSMGIELHKVRSAVEFIIGRGDRVVIGEIGLTPRSKRVIELAVDEARRLHHDYIGTEHLLLGLVREGEGVAAGVLESLGASLERVRMYTLAVLKGEVAEVKPAGEQWRAVRFPTPSSETQIFTSQFGGMVRSNHATASLAKAVERAAAEALLLNSPTLRKEHLLLGLLGVPGSIATRVLNSLGITLETSRQRIVDAVEHTGVDVVAELKVPAETVIYIHRPSETPSVKANTGDLLLTILSDYPEGAAQEQGAGSDILLKLLAESGHTPEQVREAVQRALSSGVAGEEL